MAMYKRLVTVAVLLMISTSSLYVIYSSIQDGEPSRHQALGSLLAVGEETQVRRLEGTEGSQVMSQIQALPEWASALDFLSAKEILIDPASAEVYEAMVSGYVLSILRAGSQYSPHMSTGMGEIIIVMDDAGMIFAWILVTNLPPLKADSFFDVFYEVDLPPTESASVPVTTWSNGLPVFYVSFYHFIGGMWVPYHYWWNEAENHPNWYYSYYNWWWWYYQWHGYYWIPWFDWFFSWYYRERFYYWSTWFPVGEPLVGLLVAVSAFAVGRQILAKRGKIVRRDGSWS